MYWCEALGSPETSRKPWGGYEIRRHEEPSPSNASDAPATLTNVYQPRPGRVFLPDGPDFVHYVAVKMYVYRRVVDQASLRLVNGSASAGSFNETITARRLRHAISSGHRANWSAAEDFPDFLECTAHTFRERLRSLNHGSFLEEQGRGVRDAVQYKWQEPILYSNVCSFLAIERVTKRHVVLALDAYRLREAFGGAAFGEPAFRQLATQHRDQQRARRWFPFARTTPEALPIKFNEFLTKRLRMLAEIGLVQMDGAKFTLTPGGLDAAHWFDLFAHSVAYRPSQAQCDACPLQAPCWRDDLGTVLGIRSSIPRRALVMGPAPGESPRIAA